MLRTHLDPKQSLQPNKPPISLIFQIQHFNQFHHLKITALSHKSAKTFSPQNLTSLSHLHFTVSVYQQFEKAFL